MMRAAVIGAGPAGLMAAEVLGQGGAQVTVYDQMPSPGRKFLMAGKSGLNLTMDGDDAFASRFDCPALAPMLAAFGPEAVKAWADGLGAEVFAGSAGRVFPKAMKASPLLRAWLARLAGYGARLQTRARWQGWDGDALLINAERVEADVTILALGGASWARLGSDGAWAKHLPHTPFRPANVGLSVNWSAHMAPHFGAPIKGVAWHAGGTISRGEAILTARGLEGSGIYTASRAVRDGAALHVDLMPDVPLETIRQRLDRPGGKASLSNHIRKALRLPPVKQALLMECARPLPADLAPLIKALPLPITGQHPLDEAISTAGGVRWDALDDTLMLKNRPRIYCVGEMLDWEAPTGGYLITGCLATGRWAARSALGAFSL
ncbi:MAG: TIGR03862 family flavoprotein [Pseudomonadota bacterium]